MSDYTALTKITSWFKRLELLDWTLTSPSEPIILSHLKQVLSDLKINQNCVCYVPLLPSPITFKSEREGNYSQEVFPFAKPQTLARQSHWRHFVKYQIPFVLSVSREGITWNHPRHGMIKRSPTIWLCCVHLSQASLTSRRTEIGTQ